MELEAVKRLLEGSSTTTPNDDDDDQKKKNPSSDSTSIDDLPEKFFDPFIILGIRVDLIEPGRVLCSMNVPRRLLNSGNFLHGGATASLVDVLGSAAITTVSESRTSGVSVEISVSYMDSAFLDEEIEMEAKVLRVGRTVGVASVELRKKKTGKIIAQGRHTKYLPITSKL